MPPIEDNTEGVEPLREDLPEADKYPLATVSDQGQQVPTTPIITEERRAEILGRVAEFYMRLEALAPMQQNFVLAMLKDASSGRRAAILAGSTEKNAAYQANQWLGMDKIQAALAAGQLLREDRTMVTSERTMNELAIIAYSDITDFEMDRMTGEIKAKEGKPEYATRAIQSAKFTTTVTESDSSVTTTYKAEIKLWSKTDCLRMLALMQNMLSGSGGAGGDTINDNRQLHVHQHNTWVVGDRKITF